MPPASRGIDNPRGPARTLVLLVVPFCFALSFWLSYRPHVQHRRRLSSAGSACDGLAGLVSSSCRSAQRGGRARRQGPPAEEGSGPGPDLTGLPPEFDWKAYTLYNPQLGIQSEAEAQRHYLAEGRAQGRVYRKLRVLLRYTAGTGLINQHYSHIAAFALAAVLGAEVVLPPAMHRSSFQHIFSVRARSPRCFSLYGSAA